MSKNISSSMRSEPFIYPRHSGTLAGVEIPTVEPKQKTLFFIGPRMGKKGDACRKAKKHWQNISEKNGEYENLKRKIKGGEEGLEEKFEELEKTSSEDHYNLAALDYITESLAQQYQLKEGTDYSGKDPGQEMEDFKAAVCEYITEEQLLTIPISIQNGEYIQVKDIRGMASDEKKI